MDTSYLTTQVANIIGQLHGLFDEIGVPNHERESREAELFTALSETLHNQLRQVTAEKNEMTEEAHRIIKTIRQLEASLEDNKPNDYPEEDEELKVYAPLNRCLKSLKEKHNAIAKIHRERFEQVKKLVVALESYSSHLEPSFIKVTLPPTSKNATIPPNFDLSPSYVTSIDDEFTRVYEEYNKRLGHVKAIAEEIVNLWAELGIPQAQTDSTIVENYRNSPEQLGLHQSDISRLVNRRDKLVEEKRSREKRVKELRGLVEALWERLGVEDLDRKRFVAGTRGCGLRVINEYEAELDRLAELKKQNLHLFVEDARYKLQELWDALYFSEEDMLDFTPAFSDVFSDALLSAHEAEIARLEVLKEQRLPTLQLIERHRTLVAERDELANSSQDASRLMLRGQKGEKRDPGKLLREEKMRKRIAKELPKVSEQLRKVLTNWENEYGRPFLVHGEPYLDEMDAAEVRGKPAPSRARTPGLPPAATKPAPATKRAASKPAPPSRAGAKTPVAASRKNAQQAGTSSVSNSMMSKANNKPGSPSKIPARVPLSPMKTGSNSPERRQPPQSAPSYDPNTARKMGPPPRAPPPKMRDLAPAPPSVNTSHTFDSENWRCESAASIDSGPVRQVSPEDVYDDREHMSYAPPDYPNASAPGGARPAPPIQQNSWSQHVYAQPNGRQPYAPSSSSQPSHSSYHADSSRVVSTASSATSHAASGSENWETYDEVSEPERDASAAYYAKLKAGAAVHGGNNKRPTPDGGHGSGRAYAYAGAASPSGKKLRSIYERSPGRVQQTYVVEGGVEGGRLVPAGNEAGWVDEDAF